MKNTGLVSLLLSLLPLCSLIFAASIKNNDHVSNYNFIRIKDNGGARNCPLQRYYIKPENDICHTLCTSDKDCKGNNMCCPDNCHSMCKPPPQDKPGVCPSYESAFAPTERCNDYCSTDAECPGNKKCCKKGCRKTCTPTLNDIGKAVVETAARKGFCPQEEIPFCGIEERKFCDETSCLDGLLCCPNICRWECREALTARAGDCPAQCPPDAENKTCTSDYDCAPLHKCCSVCGNRCVRAVNVPSFLHRSNATIFLQGGGR
ncbi:whey acidic protein-like [Dendropsophus ebraccatus]|uniref:whey acidic protein-like n=1 Tax=Dendropsophus ebraccatus TaxID=150705 RepID=UPI0038317CB5